LFTVPWQVGVVASSVPSGQWLMLSHTKSLEMQCAIVWHLNSRQLWTGTTTIIINKNGIHRVFRAGSSIVFRSHVRTREWLVGPVRDSITKRSIVVYYEIIVRDRTRRLCGIFVRQYEGNENIRGWTTRTAVSSSIP